MCSRRGKKGPKHPGETCTAGLRERTLNRIEMSPPLASLLMIILTIIMAAILYFFIVLVG